MSLVATAWGCHALTTLLLDGVPIAECSGFGEHSDVGVEHARRLAACWNAFEGIPVNNIERVGKGVAFNLNAAALWDAALVPGVIR